MTNETKKVRRYLLSRKRDVMKALDRHTGKNRPVQSVSCVVCNWYLGQIRSLDAALEFTSVRPLGAGNPDLPSDHPIDD